MFIYAYVLFIFPNDANIYVLVNRIWKDILKYRTKYVEEYRYELVSVTREILVYILENNFASVSRHLASCH